MEPIDFCIQVVTKLQFIKKTKQNKTKKQYLQAKVKQGIPRMKSLYTLKFKELKPR